MGDQTAELLLREFRDFRSEIQEWRQDTTERVVRLETVVKPALQGNGQPAQIIMLDRRVTRLEKALVRVTAVGATVVERRPLRAAFPAVGTLEQPYLAVLCFAHRASVPPKILALQPC